MSWLKQLYFKLLYYRNPPWDTQVSPPELMDFIAQHSPGRALDLGCGTGTNVIALAKHGWQAIGVDYIGRAIGQARKKAQLEGVSVEFQIDDVTKLTSITGEFDLVLDIGCFHSLSADEKRAYILNLERLTGPGSYYLMYGFCQSADRGGPGMLNSDLKGIEKNFNLINRVSGTDRDRRPSVWLRYQRKPADNLEQGLNS